MNNGSKSLNLFFSNSIFIGSFKEVENIPYSDLDEFCFIGRSNVGKSSIINAITKSKKLAKISKTPGRTQSANLFLINKKINIVDLPGYGYAKLSFKIREELNTLLDNYLSKRNNLKNVYLLLDCKIGVKNIDLDTINKILDTNNNFNIILTKTDKCSDDLIIKQKESISLLMKNYTKNFSNIFLSSIKKNDSIKEIQKDLYNLAKI